MPFNILVLPAGLAQPEMLPVGFPGSVITSGNLTSPVPQPGDKAGKRTAAGTGKPSGLVSLSHQGALPASAHAVLWQPVACNFLCCPNHAPEGACYKEHRSSCSVPLADG